MNDLNAKRYYKKINTTFAGVNKSDEFAQIFMNVLKSGNTTLYQKERRERRVFDDAWMSAVEAAVPVIDKITRSPRENLKQMTMIVPVERAKKTDKDTVRHLAANTQLIKSISREGVVTPSKVMTSFNESDFGTYENRFLKTLVDKLYLFIEKRYDIIVKKMHTEYVNFLNVKSAINWESAAMEFDVTLKINQNLPEDEIDRKNQELLDRMTTLRTSITNFKMSLFMSQMREFPPVNPPIMKTNIIMKNPDFKQCYNLWLMMDSLDQIGFDIDVFERDVEFDDQYLERLQNSLMVLYATVADNQKDEFVISQENPYSFRQEKRGKIAKVHAGDMRMEPGVIELENNRLNQYYLEQIKKSNYSRLKTLKEAGITVRESIDIVFKQINDITNAVYKDYLAETFDPAAAPTLDEKIKVQEQMLEVYRMIDEIKRVDLKEMSTQRAVALLELRNMKDQKAAILEAERAEKARIQKEEEDRKRKEEAERKAAEAAKKRKIEAAKKALALAEQKRKEKLAKEKAEQKARETAEREKQKRIEREKLEKERAKQRAIELAARLKKQEQERREKARLEEIARREAAKKALEEIEKAIAEGGLPPKPKTSAKKAGTPKQNAAPKKAAAKEPIVVAPTEIEAKNQESDPQ
ncbi:MAG: hypothetical protein WC509_08750 [Candidatus Izemoplasmatales bacterium]